MDQRSNEVAVGEAATWLIRPRRPICSSNKRAFREACTFAIAAVCDKPGPRVVGKLAIIEADVPDLFACFGFDIDTCARGTGEARFTGMIELAIPESNAAPPNQTYALTTVVLTPYIF